MSLLISSSNTFHSHLYFSNFFDIRLWCHPPFIFLYAWPSSASSIFFPQNASLTLLTDKNNSYLLLTFILYSLMSRFHHFARKQPLIYRLSTLSNHLVIFSLDCVISHLRFVSSLAHIFAFIVIISPPSFNSLDVPVISCLFIRDTNFSLLFELPCPWILFLDSLNVLNKSSLIVLFWIFGLFFWGQASRVLSTQWLL